MLMGAAHNALWAFNARVSLTLPVCHRPQAATLALRSGAVRSPVTVVPSCGLETRSWRTDRMARHKQECIRLPYTAALASQRAFFVKVLPLATKEKKQGKGKLFSLSDRACQLKYYRDLLSVKAVSSKYVKARTEYLTPHTVREVHKTLRNAFNQAVKWELMTRNPVEHATLPKEEHKTRDIWTAEVLQKALEACDDDILRLAINLAFSCSLRMGELLGLTWDCIDISPTSIELGQASIFVEKELQRVNREAMADLDGKDIMFKFPPTFASTHTALVLKTPKTKTSVRKVFLPKTVAEMLVQRKADIEELKDLFGDEFVDFNLVFCSSNGKPIEGQVINRAFNKLIEEKGLPKVVFHSLRHSSITYKLKLNGGDMKSVQGDSGHAQVKMVADVYSHIIDDDRRLNAERMEAAFYSGRQATPEPVQPAATESSADDKELLLKLLQNPEMAALLKSLAKTL